VTCINCGQETAREIDPETDPVFVARQGVLPCQHDQCSQAPADAAIALVAAEHTAQLTLLKPKRCSQRRRSTNSYFKMSCWDPMTAVGSVSAIDVLSCTTTMEVGIDIGTLSGVSLRNMPQRERTTSSAQAGQVVVATRWLP